MEGMAEEEHSQGGASAAGVPIVAGGGWKTAQVVARPKARLWRHLAWVALVATGVLGVMAMYGALTGLCGPAVFVALASLAGPSAGFSGYAFLRARRFGCTEEPIVDTVLLPNDDCDPRNFY